MANAIYKKGIEAILNGAIDLDTDNIKVVLVDLADYTVNLATHDFLADVDGGTAVVATSPNLTSPTITDGVFDAADFTFTGVSGDQSEALIIYRDSGASATSELIAFIDTATGFPITPDGGNIDVAWDGGANRIINFDS